MNSNNTPRAAGEAAHTPTPYYNESTNRESANIVAADRVVAHVYDKKDRAFIVRACNEYDANKATIKSAAQDLELVADMLETGPAPKPETLRKLAAAYRAALDQTR